ncbi:MAG: hypothetical protein RIT45_423 [Pseudomonadota bacterium]|jgi:biopolymer transport protein ExbB
MNALWPKLQELLLAGGWVMPPLVLAAAVLWAGLAWRATTLRRAVLGGVERVLASADATAVGPDAATAAARRRRLDAAVLPARLWLGSGRRLVEAIVVAAPLTGLLGTVSGMIGTFEALSDGAATATGGVAGGISEALLTTQAGLVVAIPGLLVGRLLARRERALLAGIDRLLEQRMALGPDGAATALTTMGGEATR